jgi:16S rRNA (adenine1518-N6/adenine1519-N6)-dimethyltransferase
MKIFNPEEHRARKRFGQNFLTDELVIQKIVTAIQPSEKNNLVEIGPGLGALTRRILPHTKKMSVIELDRDVIPKLKFNCEPYGELVIHQQDALKMNFSSLAKPSNIRVIGNLPYNISTPILFHLFEHLDVIDDMHFMLQKEVVERMVANPGSKTYGRLSVMTQYFCDAYNLFLVPPTAFNPQPKVDSAIVRLKPKKNQEKVIDFSYFSELVTQAFNQRRKTIRNVWKNKISLETLEALNIDPQLRPENLTLSEFIAVANIKG